MRETFIQSNKGKKLFDFEVNSEIKFNETCKYLNKENTAHNLSFDEVKGSYTLCTF